MQIIRNLLSFILLLILQLSFANSFANVYLLEDKVVSRIEFSEKTNLNFSEPDFRENYTFEPSFQEFVTHPSVSNCGGYADLVESWKSVKYCGDDELAKLATNLDELDVVAKNADEITKAGGYKGWKLTKEGSKLVEQVKLGNYLGKKGAYEIYENGEVFYRSISKEHYDELVRSNRMPGTGECTTSPNKAFSEGYEGYLIKFKVKSGTIDELKTIGVTDGNPLVKAQFGEMPTAKEIGGSWNQTRARFKVETLKSTGEKQVNIALGNGTALEKFNNNILEFELIQINP